MASATPNDPDPKKDWKIAGIAAAVVIVICGAGTGIGAALLAAADQNESCAPRAAQGSWDGLQVSGLPDSLQLPFGYGRGTRTVQNVITVTAPAGTTPPAAIQLFAEPLVTTDGSQSVPQTAPTTASASPSPGSRASGAGTANASATTASTTPSPGSGASGTGTANASVSASTTPSPGSGASGTGTANAGAGTGTSQLVSATATRIASSSIYQIELCVTASTVAAGSYSGQLLFPGATLASGTSLPVTVTFQSRLLPFVLTAGGLPLALCGVLYTTLILIKRSNTGSCLGDVVGGLYKDLWSIKGLVALLLG